VFCFIILINFAGVPRYFTVSQSSFRSGPAALPWFLLSSVDALFSWYGAEGARELSPEQSRAPAGTIARFEHTSTSCRKRPNLSILRKKKSKDSFLYLAASYSNLKFERALYPVERVPLQEEQIYQENVHFILEKYKKREAKLRVKISFFLAKIKHPIYWLRSLQGLDHSKFCSFVMSLFSVLFNIMLFSWHKMAYRTFFLSKYGRAKHVLGRDNFRYCFLSNPFDF